MKMNKTSTFVIAKPGTTPKFIECPTWEEFCETTFKKFETNKKEIEKRYKEIPQVVTHYTESVRLYGQARDLYCLGYFESSIIVSRSVVEYLASEIFVEQIDLNDEREKIETIAENLDFRKIIENFLYKKDNQLINKETKELFHKLYTTGNDWVHPKRSKIKKTKEEDAKDILILLTKLMKQLRCVFNNTTIINGFVAEKTSLKRCNGIKLAED